MAKITHKGKHANRREWNPREEAFARIWEKENEPRAQGPCLAWLLHAKPCENSIFGEATDRPLTQEEVTVSATVIQWLGSNVGWCFLGEALRECGYEIVPRKAAAEVPRG